MEFTATTTVDTLREMATLNRKRFFRPLSVLGNVRAVLYLIVFACVGGTFIVQGLQATPIGTPRILKGLLVLAILAAVLGFLFYSRVRETEKRLAANPPVRYIVNTQGVALVDTVPTEFSEPVAFTPWTAFSTFRMGKHIATLNRADHRGFHTIPIDSLSPMQTGQLRSILLSHLPEKI